MNNNGRYKKLSRKGKTILECIGQLNYFLAAKSSNELQSRGDAFVNWVGQFAEKAEDMADNLLANNINKNDAILTACECLAGLAEVVKQCRLSIGSNIELCKGRKKEPLQRSHQTLLNVEREILTLLREAEEKLLAQRLRPTPMGDETFPQQINLVESKKQKRKLKTALRQPTRESNC